MINAEFRQLAKLLSEINHLATEEEQLAAIEIRLVEAELNPTCLDFDDLRHALKVLAKVNLEGREWQQTPQELETYF
jgi:hypothetical protein